MSVINNKGDNSIINTIDNNITHGVKNGVLHLTTKGPHVIYNDRTLLNFSSYSYLNLEHHQKLKSGAINAINKYGTQFGYSRAFISVDLYHNLEARLESIFEAPTVLAPSTTLAHQATMPILISEKDIVLIDQYAHASMHFTIKNIKENNVPVELVRHNNIQKIEERIIQLKNTYRRIWYVCDGVYSMYGDFVPAKALSELMDRYDNFYVYFDDAHGLSWTGKHGRGYILNQIKMHHQMVVVTSLNKSFAASGGAIVLPNQEWKRKIRTCGGPMIFSTPIQPPMLGAGIASADIHLSDEIIALQKRLANNTNYLTKTLQNYHLPDISENNSPIFYLPTSFPKVSYNLVKRMMNEGIYLTPALFPAVSMRRAGIRYCVNAEHTYEQIEQLVQGLKHHYHKSINEEEVNIKKIYDFFKIEPIETKPIDKTHDTLPCQTYHTINDINIIDWNTTIGKNGALDWHTMQCYERSFSNNELKENNWDFYYYVIRDHENNIELVTVVTKCWCKDDLFKPPHVSVKLEQIRKNNPYFLCSEALLMGTPLTEGEHLYLKNKENLNPVSLLLDKLNELQNELGLNSIYLRDFDTDNNVLADFFLDNGFIKVEMPEPTNILNCRNWHQLNDFLDDLPRKKRKEVKYHALKHENKFDIEIKGELNETELAHFYDLYLAVKTNSFILNTFNIPFGFMNEVNKNDCWEFIVLKLQPNEYQENNKELPVAMILCNKSVNNYIPQLIGLNYNYLNSHKIYKQSILQIVKRAIALQVNKVFFGITASTEKKRFGAKPVEKNIFLQVKDNFNMNLLELESYPNTH